jgi:hypothetical protein
VRAASARTSRIQGAGLAPVVVFGVQGVSGVDHVPIGVPPGRLAVARDVGLRSASWSWGHTPGR